MAEYGSMFLVSGLASILFFGGWNGPLPIFGWLGWSDAGGVLGYLADLAGCANFMIKAVVGVTVMMWARWTLPRLRIDQVMTTCLKYCTPLAAVCFVGALAWQTGLFGLLNAPLWSPNDVFARQTRGEIRESWVLEADRPVPSADEVAGNSRFGEPISREDGVRSLERESVRAAVPQAGRVAVASRKGGAG